MDVEEQRVKNMQMDEVSWHKGQRPDKNERSFRMKWHSIKFTLLAAVSLLMTTTFAHAQQSCDWGCQSMSCAPSAPCCPCGSLCLQGDLLYWKALGSNISYLSDFEDQFFEVDTFSTDDFRLVTRRKCLDFDRKVGFRVGARYDFACNCWNISFLWTHFKTEASGKTDKFKTKFDVASPLKSFYDVKAHYDLDLNYWDLEMARSFCVSKCVKARLFLGVRGATIDQKYKSFSEYVVEEPFASMDTPFPGPFRQLITVSERALDIREKHRFNGAGPRIGFDFDADLFCSVGLYGQAALSGLVGCAKRDVDSCFTDRFVDFQSSQMTKSLARQFAGVFVFQDVDEQSQKIQANRAMTDFSIGFRWSPGFICGCQNLTLRFGWEHHAIFGQKYAYFGQDKLPVSDEILSITSFVPNDVFKECNSTLAVYGFVFSARLCF